MDAQTCAGIRRTPRGRGVDVAALAVTCGTYRRLTAWRRSTTLARVDERLTDPTRIDSIGAGRWAVGVGLYVFTVTRGLDRVNFYALGHWLLTWNHGFVKRGLMGTLLEPLLWHKDRVQIETIVSTVSVIVFTSLSIAILWCAGAIVRFGTGSPRGFFLAPTALAFLGSSGVILMASTLGYLDHVLTGVTLLAIMCVAEGRLVAAAALSVVGVAVHEIFVLYGLPVVWLAVLLHANLVTGGKVPTRVASLRRAFPFLLPSLVAIVFVLLAHAEIPAERTAALRDDLARTGSFKLDQLNGVMYPLEHGFMQDFAAQAHLSGKRLMDVQIGRVAWPAIFSLFASTSALLAASRMRWFIPGMAAVVLAPLAIHLLGQDAPRFTNLAVMQAFCCLTTVVLVARPALPGIRAAWALALLAGLSLTASLLWKAPLMGGKVDGETAFGIRLMMPAVPVSAPGPTSHPTERGLTRPASDPL